MHTRKVFLVILSLTLAALLMPGSSEAGISVGPGLTQVTVRPSADGVQSPLLASSSVPTYVTPSGSASDTPSSDTWPDSTAAIARTKNFLPGAITVEFRY